MANCQNCGAHVSARALRVMFANESEDPEYCPMCGKKEGSQWVEPRSPKYRDSQAGPDT